MKIILLQDIDKIGKKYDVKAVKDGYARNFLIPKGLAKQATKVALKWAEAQKEIFQKQIEGELQETQELATKIDGAEVLVQVKIGDQNQLFEHITAQKISEKLKEMGYTVKKAQIDLADPIKEVGEFPIKIKFEHNLEAEITVIVTEEKK